MDPNVFNINSHKHTHSNLLHEHRIKQRKVVKICEYAFGSNQNEKTRDKEQMW
mgnify:CR=1 FL=1